MKLFKLLNWYWTLHLQLMKQTNKCTRDFFRDGKRKVSRGFFRNEWSYISLSECYDIVCKMTSSQHPSLQHYTLRFLASNATSCIAAMNLFKHPRNLLIRVLPLLGYRAVSLPLEVFGLHNFDTIRWTILTWIKPVPGVKQ